MAAHQTLNDGHDGEEINYEELKRAVRTGCSTFCCVDGGRREDGRAACGFAIYVVRKGAQGIYRFTSMARVGRSLGRLCSAFLAESCSLQLALDFLAEILDTWQARIVNADSLCRAHSCKAGNINCAKTRAGMLET